MTELFTIPDYLTAYKNGETTPTAAIKEVYARIAAHNDPAIFITLRPMADALAEAAELEKKGADKLALYGIPFAVKDNIDVAGLPTTAACPDFSFMPAKDATAVAKLRKAGAIVIGKTNLDQFATGLVGTRSPYGTPRNVFRADMVPGGSSSGSGVVVAAGLVPFALGTDTAGSGRVPAALNNIVGLKPSLGLISTSGVVPACRSLDCVSIFALDASDAFTALTIAAGFDAADPFSREIATGQPGDIVSALRIGVPDTASRRFGGDKESEAAFDRSIADMSGIGSHIRTVDFTPLYKVAALLYEGAWVAERYQAIRDFIETKPSSLHPVTSSIISSATKLSAADAFSGLYRLKALAREAEALWRDIDVLVVPTFPRPRTLADLAADPIGPNSELGTYTNFVNLLDLCAFAVPGRFRGDGFPSGVTLIAPCGKDALLASIAARLHQLSGVTLGATQRPLAPSTWTAPRPDSSAKADTIEIVVIGAHLSGLPLNGELTSRGAKFLRSADTTADYRLFALPGGPPKRPGLLRVADGTGRAIATEVWALAPDAFGDFVASVPAPLSIGTIRLADGTQPKGFLVEAEAVKSATDISGFGGWRAYIKDSAAA